MKSPDDHRMKIEFATYSDLMGCLIYQIRILWEIQYPITLIKHNLKGTLTIKIDK